MKILVLSDSHSGLYFMRECISSVRPDGVIHLGDFFDDGEAMALENPHIRFWLLPGNGDCFSVGARAPKVLNCLIGGVRMYMTHGHLHGVKSNRNHLVSEAKANGAQIVLYGHTHVPECICDEDGVWVLNPGTCRSASGSVGLIEIQENRITSCRVLRQEDLGPAL